MLLFHVQRNQLPWFKHLTRIPPGHIVGEMFWACHTRRRPQVRLRRCWRDYIFGLALEHLSIVPDKLQEVAGERELWVSLLKLLPHPGSSDFSLFLVLILYKTSVIIHLLNIIIQLLGMFESSTFLHIRLDNINCCLCPHS